MKKDKELPLRVELQGPEQNRQAPAFPDFDLLGIVTLGEESGDLVCHRQSGTYGMARDGLVRLLDQRRVKAALGLPVGAGAPVRLLGGRRLNVYLDIETLTVAHGLGAGNVSEGIRRALRHAAENLLPRQD